MLFAKRIVFLILAFFIIAAAVAPLFESGFFPMHDDEQIGRLYDLDQALRQGQFPVRILPNLGFGYGYPLFNFYPPFIYYTAEVFKVSGFSYIDSTKITIGLGFFLSFLFMYLFSKEYFGRLGGLVSAAAYTYAPYHAVDVYVRGALPEAFAFVFIPAIFWSLFLLSKTNKNRYLILTSLFTALLIVTHNLVAFMALPFAVVYFLFLFIRNKNKTIFAVKAVFSGVLGFMISAFFWLPSYLEKSQTLVDILTVEKGDYNLHFVYPRQFINDSAWGYSGSVPGPWDGMSLSIGMAHAIILVFILILLASFIFKKRARNYMIFILFFLFLGFSLFIQTAYSRQIWDLIAPLSYIQFPWRFLLFSSFTISFLIGGYAFFVKDRRIKYLLAVLIISFLVSYNKDFFTPKEHFYTAKDIDYIREEFIRWNTSILAFEYVPAGVSTTRSIHDTTIIDIDKDKIKKEAFEVVGGEMDVEVVDDRAHRKEFMVSVSEEGMFRINTFSYPGWKVYKNREEVLFSDDNDLRLITFFLPVGEYRIMAVFEDTGVRKASNILSLIGILTLTGVILINKRTEKYGRL